MYQLFALFLRNIADHRALIDSGREVNAMTTFFAFKLGFKLLNTNIRAQKIDGSTFKTFVLVLATFQIENKLEKTQFYKELFLLDDISLQVVLKMLF